MGYDDFEGGGGVTLFPYYDLGGGGGCGKFPAKITSGIMGANHFLDLLVSKYKMTQDSLMVSKS